MPSPSARPGDVIEIVDGEYLFDERLVASASGVDSAPITLRGTRAAMIRTKDVSDDYGLHVTGDHWRIEGITIAHASKGIVLDGSIGTVIDGVEVYEIGDEAVHFRACSSDGVLRNSFVHDTGRDSPQYGEGAYVGSANSNWSDYECTDPLEGVDEGDNTERVLIENNVFEDITAEGVDLKEGTDSGTVRGNVFRRAGLSGREQRRLGGRCQGQQLGRRGQRGVGDRCAVVRRGTAAPERVRRRVPGALRLRRLRDGQRVPQQRRRRPDPRLRDRLVPIARQRRHVRQQRTRSDPRVGRGQQPVDRLRRIHLARSAPLQVGERPEPGLRVVGEPTLGVAPQPFEARFRPQLDGVEEGVWSGGP